MMQGERGGREAECSEEVAARTEEEREDELEEQDDKEDVQPGEEGKSHQIWSHWSCRFPPHVDRFNDRS